MANNINQTQQILDKNGIKYNPAFITVLNKDYSQDQSKYDVAQKLVTRIDYLAGHGVNHGFVKELKDDIFALTNACDKLGKDMKPKQYDQFLKEIGETMVKTYGGKNDIDVRETLVKMIENTAGGIEEYQKAYPDPATDDLYKKTAKKLNEYAKKINGFFDNYSKKAAEIASDLYLKIYEEIRLKFGNDSLTSYELDVTFQEIEEKLNDWNNLIKSGEKSAKLEDTYDFNPKNPDSFYIKSINKNFREKYEIFSRKVKDYKEQTEKRYTDGPLEELKNHIQQEIDAFTKEQKLIAAQLAAKRITQAEAIAKAKRLELEINSRKPRLKDLLIKSENNAKIKLARDSVYYDLLSIQNAISPDYNDPELIYVYSESLDLGKINEMLFGVSLSDEEKMKQIEMIKTIVRLDHRKQVEDIKRANDMRRATITSTQSIDEPLFENTEIEIENEMSDDSILAKLQEMSNGSIEEENVEEKENEVNLDDLLLHKNN